MINELKIQINKIRIQCWIFFIPIAMSFQTNQNQGENQPPLVEITAPLANSHFQWNKEIRYTIHVSDKEDGNSDYDEINGREVIMQIAYLADSATLDQFRKEGEAEPRAIAIMKTSTCFNCHTSRNKLIGPSFDRIANRYHATETTLDNLTQKVMHGSRGSWGDVQMPSNTDLKPEDIKEVVRWIIKHNKTSNVFYQVGLTGSFRIKEHTEQNSKKSIYVLTASYLDHGKPDQKKRGQHSVIIRPEKF